jgi:RPA family protein
MKIKLSANNKRDLKRKYQLTTKTSYKAKRVLTAGFITQTNLKIK